MKRILPGAFSGILILSLIIHAFSGVYAADRKTPQWIDFKNGGSKDYSSIKKLPRKHRLPKIERLGKADNELIFDFQIPGTQIRTIRRSGEDYHVLSIPTAGHTGAIGEPDLPSVNRYINVPVDAAVKVEALDSSFTVVNDVAVIPAQEPLADATNAKVPEFKKNKSLYKQSKYYPSKIVDFEGPFVIRGRSVIIVKVSPVQYNPKKKSIRVFDRIRVKVSFSGGRKKFIKHKKYRSKSFDKTLKQLLLNADSLEADALPSDKLLSDAALTPQAATGAAYDASNSLVSLLIVTHPDFEEAANALASWKRRLTIDTVVATTDITGTTATEIQSYIQNAYDNWNTPPDSVLLIGDAEFIPTNYVTVHPYEKHETGTDLYYATVDGTDYFPDIAIGRLSVDTFDEANKRVNDIIEYENSALDDELFYQKATIATFFQDDDNDSTSDRRFAQTSEDLAIFLSDSNYLGQYSIDRVYTTPSDRTPERWTSGYTSFTGGPAGESGDPIPSYLTKPGFAWDGDRSDISAHINDGRFLVTHRDHGNKPGWIHPGYSVSDVQSLTNGDKLPVVWSVNCRTGWFDNETDSASANTPASDIHFSEAWERNPNGGAVGLIAATRVSYSSLNDRLFWGWADAIWPEFVNSYNQTGESIKQMGQVLNYGKLYFAAMYSNDAYRKLQFEIYHWFGDPTMRIRTEKTNFPDINLSATPMEDINSDLWVKLSWTSDFVESCVSSWQGAEPANGAYLEELPTVPTSYTIICTGDDSTNGETINQTITIDPNDPEWMENLIPMGGAKVFQHSNYEGYAVNLAAGDYTLSDLTNKGIINDDLSSIKVSDNYLAVLYQNDNFSGQRWFINSAEVYFDATGWDEQVSSIRIIDYSSEIDSQITIDEEADYTITAKHSGKRIDTILQPWLRQYSAHSGDSQRWRIAKLRDENGNWTGVYTMTSKELSQCVDTGWLLNAGKIISRQCIGYNLQQWFLVSAQNGTYNIIQRTAKSCLDVEYGLYSDSALIVHTRCSGYSSQDWLIEKD